MAYLLGTCNHIRVFEVAGNNISNEGANQLANKLHISGNKLTQQGVSILNQLVQKIRLYKFFKPYTNYKRISRFKI